MELKTFFEIFDRYGILAVILAVIIVVLWKIGKWLAPRADEAIRRHFSLIDKIDQNQELQNQNSIKTGLLLERVLSRQDSQDVHLKKISDSVSSMCERVETVVIHPTGGKSARNK